MYDDHFYAAIRAGAQRSADALVPILIDEYHIQPDAKIIDVGCGEGTFALAFADRGHEVIGLDGPYHTNHPLGERFLPHNLDATLPGHLAGRFDVAICLEVAEHLRPNRAASFIAELCGLAPFIIFSAAIPNQGGTNHVNEQWPDYWAGLFNKQGYALDGELRLKIWNDDRIENWYRQNLFVAGTGWSQGEILPLVHPILWSAYR